MPSDMPQNRFGAEKDNNQNQKMLFPRLFPNSIYKDYIEQNKIDTKNTKK